MSFPVFSGVPSNPPYVSLPSSGNFESKPYQGFFAQPTESATGLSKCDQIDGTGIYNPRKEVAEACLVAVKRAESKEKWDTMPTNAVYEIDANVKLRLDVSVDDP